MSEYKLWYTNRVRIGIIGAYASGKTTYIKSVAENFDSITTKKYVDGVGVYDSTLAYDYGVFFIVKKDNEYLKIPRREVQHYIDRGDSVYRVELWGSAGQKHLYIARQTIIYPRVDALFLFFDISREKSFELSLYLYKEAKRSLPSLEEIKPLIVVLNKTDLVNNGVLQDYLGKINNLLGNKYRPGDSLFTISAKYRKNIWVPIKRVLDILVRP